MSLPFSPKQLEFILHSHHKWNLLWGAMRSGKTVGGVFRFMQAVNDCPDSKIYIAGHSFETAYRNVVQLIMESEELSIFRPFCTWSGKKLHFKDKSITILGAKDKGAIGSFQGDTYSLIYCNEFTLFPDEIIQTIDTRLSNPHSMGFADMNPTYPSHQVKNWIDWAEQGNPQYYALHFTLDDNPYVGEDYKERIRNSLSGVFYKRNYLGLWCLAEGAIFDFFDKDLYIAKKPPKCANYWIAGIDYGTHNSFACVLIGVNTGQFDQTGPVMWVEKEYVWDCTKTGRQKTCSEYARDVEAFLEPYACKAVYVDPSAAPFKVEMQRKGSHITDAQNDVYEGIVHLISEMKDGSLKICAECKNLIREIEGYVWDSKAAERGEDRPVKKDDHCIDALRYAVYSHRVPAYRPYKEEKHNEYLTNRFNPGARRF